MNADPSIGRKIADALASIPHINPQTFDKIFRYVHHLRLVSFLTTYLLCALLSWPSLYPCLHHLCSNNVQDLLMVVYLSNLTKTQLAVTNKIGQVLT